MVAGAFQNFITVLIKVMHVVIFRKQFQKANWKPAHLMAHNCLLPRTSIFDTFNWLFWHDLCATAKLAPVLYSWMQTLSIVFQLWLWLLLHNYWSPHTNTVIISHISQFSEANNVIIILLILVNISELILMNVQLYEHNSQLLLLLCTALGFLGVGGYFNFLTSVLIFVTNSPQAE